ncbi:hypothetical protein [Spirosoma sp. KNUC1025]|uniref:hypothetical protein n=1 Tax=Spirosoma sp. KNUC1025 TaxID=2894082 RepID=UPI00386AB3B9|nr:hypothetical protein LN737_15195 [Spirosoma sp. KNUC1025]
MYNLLSYRLHTKKMTMIADYLQKYINVVQWDVNQIVKVAHGAEQAYNQRYGQNSLTPVTPGPTPGLAGHAPKPTNSIATPTNSMGQTVAPTTQAPTTSARPTPTNVELFHQRHTPEYARCAVPLAMVLTSSIEFLGALLLNSNMWDNSNKFDSAVKKFFAYAELDYNQNQIDLFRAIYRNGLMHGFFPQGSSVAINYDSTFEHKPLFFVEAGDVVLNVNKLQQVVEAVFNKIVVDTSVHQTVADRLSEYNTFVEGKTRTHVDNFKASPR